MAHHPNSDLPPKSAATNEAQTTGVSYVNQQWETYYRNIQPNAALVAQYQAMGVYASHSATQNSSVGVYPSYPPVQETTVSNQLGAQISATDYHTALQQFGYLQPSTPLQQEQASVDPLPPGNEEIEIPGLSLSETDKKAAQETTQKTSNVQSGNSVGCNSDKDVVSQQLTAQQQYNTVIGARKAQQGLDVGPVATVSVGFNFKAVTDPTTAPFLIKPAMVQHKAAKSTQPPAYISINPPKPKTTMTQDQLKKIEEASKIAESFVKKAAEQATTSAEQPFQRRKRKFAEKPPPHKTQRVEFNEEEIKKQERGARFGKLSTPMPTVTSTEPTHKTKLIGRCQNLEKSYLRLSCRPDPAVVRPEAVLDKALARLVGLLKTKDVDYFYALDQFKGMRQDCTVQQLQSETCVRIYEASARSHLEYGEIWEYNQCQSNLEMLYKQGIPGCRSEFLAYRILYQALHITKGEGIALNKTIRTLTPEDQNEPEVKRAIKLVSALLANDFRCVFAHYAKTSKLGRALIDHVLDEIRYKSVRLFIKAFRLKEPIESMIEELGFYSENADEDMLTGDELVLPGCMEADYQGHANIQNDRELACINCAEWLRAHGAELIEGKNGNAEEILIDPVASRSKIFKAKAENAVAHGDPNLSMSYFLVNK